MNRRLGFRTGTTRRQRLVVWAVGLLLLAGLVGFVGRVVWQVVELDAAEEALRRHEFPAARTRLDHYLARWPGDKKALLLAARTAWFAGADADAERFLSAYEDEGGPTDASQLEWALLGAHQADFADDENRLRALVETNHPDALAILEALAMGYQISRRWPDALQALNTLIDFSPGYAALLVQRGTIVRHLIGPHALERFEEDFRRAAALAPDSATAQLALAGVLGEQGNSQEAVHHYELALRAEPTNAGALLGLARELTDAVKLDEAEQRLDELLAAHPDHPDGLVERGRLALRRRRTAEAEGFLARAVRAAPWHREGNQLDLVALKELGRSEAVAQCEARLAELKAEDATHGRLKLRARATPDDVGILWDLFQWSQRNGECAEGLYWLTNILRLDPRHAPANAAFADHFERANQPRRTALHRAAAAGR